MALPRGGPIIAGVVERVSIGPAGWLYKDWVGRVYPRPRPRGFDPLEYLAQFVDVVEVNASFYRPFSAENAGKWLERVRANPRFRFTAKLYQRFTHDRTAWTQAELDEARAAFDRLHQAERLGAVLLQFPWSFKRSAETEAWLRALAGGLRPLPLVLEVRHASWDAAEARDLLRELQLGIANIDQPLLFADSIRPAARVTSDIAYVRLHGRNYQQWGRGARKKPTGDEKEAGAPRAKSTGDARYDYLYSTSELRPWAEKIGELARAPEVRHVYATTNNHPNGKAMVNAIQLEAMLDGRPATAPPALVETYRRELDGFAAPVTAP